MHGDVLADPWFNDYRSSGVFVLRVYTGISEQPLWLLIVSIPLLVIIGINILLKESKFKYFPHVIGWGGTLCFFILGMNVASLMIGPLLVLRQ